MKILVPFASQEPSIGVVHVVVVSLHHTVTPSLHFSTITEIFWVCQTCSVECRHHMKRNSNHSCPIKWLQYLLAAFHWAFIAGSLCSPQVWVCWSATGGQPWHWHSLWCCCCTGMDQLLSRECSITLALPRWVPEVGRNAVYIYVHCLFKSLVFMVMHICQEFCSFVQVLIVLRNF